MKLIEQYNKKKREVMQICSSISQKALSINFDEVNELKYGISFEIDTAGNRIGLRIFNNKTCDKLDGKEVYCISTYFEDRSFRGIDIEELISKINIFISELKNMNIMIDKYIELNKTNTLK